MSSPELMEVVEVSEGEVVLRRSDTSEGSGEPLVTIRFSAEAREILGGQAGSLGKSMIAAGLQMVGVIFRRQMEAAAEEEGGPGDAPDTDTEEENPRRKLH